jgi:hypothetical protein
MKLTNKYNLPKSIEAWLSQNFYDRKPKSKVISATGLLKPVQEILLTEKYADSIETDVSDSIWQLFGSGIHAVLEKIDWSKYSNSFQTEERLETKINGWTISGKFDLILDNQLNDYKVTSAWTKVFGSREEEWKLQMSIYRWLYYKVHGKTLDIIAKINCIYRDFDAKNVREGYKYPSTPIEIVEISMLSLEEIEKYITDKLTAIENGIIPCTDAECWKGFDNKNKKVVYRKCAKYCPVKEFCEQNKLNQKEVK